MRISWKSLGGVLLTIVATVGVVAWWNIEQVRRLAVITLDVGYAMSTSELAPVYETQVGDKEPIRVMLNPVLEGLEQPTDLQPIPGTPHQVVVLQKGGQALWADLKTGQTAPMFSVDVITESEQGLLGLAFAPDFQTSRRFYVDYTVNKGGDKTVIQAFTVAGTLPGAEVKPGAIILAVPQPYQNHNAGQLSFGPDGMLYVSMGDGGFAYDPHEHGQNAKTYLGTLLRLDVSGARPDYVPLDNPVLPNETAPGLVWAYGLRNPWRFSWDATGRLVVADVGQDKWEEIHLVESGDNLGWNRMEGFHCFPPDDSESCDKTGLVLPIYEYDHDQGNSITGGYVARDTRIQPLLNKYVFGDFVRGRIWALDLPQHRNHRVKRVHSLGKWPLLISSFGMDGAGRMYVLDYGQGRVLRVDPPETPEER